MNDKIFVDTNVLIYAHDADASAKHQTAKNVLRELWSERSGVLSTQVLQEFYVNVTRKIQRPISKASARIVVGTYAAWCLDTTAAEISTAFQIEDAAKIGFWDALIIASALKGGASRILSEDLNPGQSIAGILIENPFVRAVRVPDSVRRPARWRCRRPRHRQTRPPGQTARRWRRRSLLPPAIW